MRAAAAVASNALCKKARCGAVIVKNGKIIGEGYNAPPQDSPHNCMCAAAVEGGKPRYDRTCCMHAEWRAVLDAVRTHPDDLSGSVLYFARIDERGVLKFSGAPYCTVCSRLALDVGIEGFALSHESGIRVYPTDEYNRLSYAYTGDTHV